jgi:quinol monooxygenase YgiN
VITIVATTHIDLACVDTFTVAARETIAASLVEDGCIAYSCSQDVTDPGAFNWIEIWRDLDAYNALGESPQHLDFLRLLADPGRVRRSGPATGMFMQAEELSAERRKEMGFTPVVEPGHVPAQA